MREIPRLTTQPKLHAVLGLINFYHRFLNHGEAILNSSCERSAGCCRRTKKELVWTDAALKLFAAAKEALTNATLLSHTALHAPTSVMTNASDLAVDALLHHFVQDEWCPIA